MQLVQTNYIPLHSQDHANSDSVSYMWVGRKRQSLSVFGNEETNSLTTVPTPPGKFWKVLDFFS